MSRLEFFRSLRRELTLEKQNDSSKAAVAECLSGKNYFDYSASIPPVDIKIEIVICHQDLLNLGLAFFFILVNTTRKRHLKNFYPFIRHILFFLLKTCLVDHCRRVIHEIFVSASLYYILEH